jgi:PPOX class probable F420-dependent enzyme
MEPREARERLAGARIAHLATADDHGRPHLVPICFAADGNTIYSAVDHKPKRSARLRRLANVAANPQAAVLADHYEDEDWGALWWVRADGTARVVASDSAERERALELLRARYAQYRETVPAGPVLAVDVVHWRGWSATGA